MSKMLLAAHDEITNGSTHILGRGLALEGYIKRSCSHMSNSRPTGALQSEWFGTYA